MPGKKNMQADNEINRISTPEAKEALYALINIIPKKTFKKLSSF